MRIGAKGQYEFILAGSLCSGGLLAVGVPLYHPSLPPHLESRIRIKDHKACLPTNMNSGTAVTVNVESGTSDADDTTVPALPPRVQVSDD